MEAYFRQMRMRYMEKVEQIQAENCVREREIKKTQGTEDRG